MKRLKLALLFAAAALMLPAAPALARMAVVVGIAPPAPVVEPVPGPSAPGYVWRSGYWQWTGVRYVWVPGVYVLAPRPGLVWAPGHWVARRGGWVWVGGYWRR